MGMKLIAVEESLLPKIQELANGEGLVPTTLEVTPDSIVVFNVKKMVQAVGKVRAATEIRRFSGAMRESLKRDLGVDVPVLCVSEDDEIRVFPPEAMLPFGWIHVPDGGIEDPAAREQLAKYVINRLTGKKET